MINPRILLVAILALSLSACSMPLVLKKPAEKKSEASPDVVLNRESTPEPPEITSPAEITKTPEADSALQPAPIDSEIEQPVRKSPSIIQQPQISAEADSVPLEQDDLVIDNLTTGNPVLELCNQVGTKLGSVSISDCLKQNLVHSAWTTANRSLAFKDYPPLGNRQPLGRVLVIGGIHGDEFSSVSVIVKWMEILDQYHSGLFHWRFIPASNPDGLLSKKSQRQNHNGVDLNRNFPSADWDDEALKYWEQKTHRNPRRDPGPSQSSELETQWLVKQIGDFNPDAIISMHAPYHLVDYDGPPAPPERFGELYFRKLGVYPGSLGNYAGIDLQIPIVTVGLQAAGIMPKRNEINLMWRDLVRWLRIQLTRSPDDAETTARTAR